MEYSNFATATDDRLSEFRRNTLIKYIHRFEKENKELIGMFSKLNHCKKWQTTSFVHEYSIYRAITIQEAKETNIDALRKYIAKTLINDSGIIIVDYTWDVNKQKLFLKLNHEIYK